MDKKNITKKYSNGEITVIWQSGKCIHSANCVRNLPQVFNTKESPWIKVNNASTAEIVETVGKCPSGALTITHNEGMKPYLTLSEAVNDLTKKGYTFNFNIQDDCIVCAENNLQLQPDEFEIDNVYRFQEMSDVDVESILYAVSSTKNNVKGLLVNAYGIYADTASAKLVEKLNISKK